jgi:hypothetical protein
MFVIMETTLLADYNIRQAGLSRNPGNAPKEQGRVFTRPNAFPTGSTFA